MSDNPVVISILYGFTKHKRRKPLHGTAIVPKAPQRAGLPDSRLPLAEPAHSDGVHGSGATSLQDRYEPTLAERDAADALQAIRPREVA